MSRPGSLADLLLVGFPVARNVSRPKRGADVNPVPARVTSLPKPPPSEMTTTERR